MIHRSSATRKKDEKEHEEVSQKRKGKNNVRKRHNGASCSLEVWEHAKNKQGRPQIEQVQEEYSRLENAGQEVLDELWKEVAFEMENGILNKCEMR